MKVKIRDMEFHRDFCPNPRDHSVAECPDPLIAVRETPGTEAGPVTDLDAALKALRTAIWADWLVTDEGIDEHFDRVVAAVRQQRDAELRAAVEGLRTIGSADPQYELGWGDAVLDFLAFLDIGHARADREDARE